MVHNPVPEGEITDSEHPHLDNLITSELLEELSKGKIGKSQYVSLY